MDSLSADDVKLAWDAYLRQTKNLDGWAYEEVEPDAYAVLQMKLAQINSKVKVGA